MAKAKVNPNKIVVADKYGIPIYNGKQLLDQKVLIRKNMKVTKSYVDSINESSSDNNKLMVVNEKATKELHERYAKKEAKRKELRELKRVEDTNVLKNIIKDAVDSKENKENK